MLPYVEAKVLPYVEAEVLPYVEAEVRVAGAFSSFSDVRATL